MTQGALNERTDSGVFPNLVLETRSVPSPQAQVLYVKFKHLSARDTTRQEPVRRSAGLVWRDRPAGRIREASKLTGKDFLWCARPVSDDSLRFTEFRVEASGGT